MTSLIANLRRLNDHLAIAVGLALLACVAFTLSEIVIRRFAVSVGGVDEISGYVMAVTTSWGVSYALTERAHVRIDLLRNQMVPLGRSILDVIAIASMAFMAVYVAWRGWSVLSKTLSTGALANTPLETPLWIPQSLWWAGWSWFAISACLLLIHAMQSLIRGDLSSVEATAGTKAEV
ncbi:TRAP transporter small permease subunit [Roseibium algae]|uniref:TRAP transporter small permease protein n=1 Tax=Roseibium algae TaxID=3123038 RepID=A0ABU8TNG6_9HYPH